jgi:hypothetical protein
VSTRGVRAVRLSTPPGREPNGSQPRGA